MIPSRIASAMAHSSYDVPRGSVRLVDFMITATPPLSVPRGASISAVNEMRRSVDRPRAADYAITLSSSSVSAFTPKAATTPADRRVRFVPGTDSRTRHDLTRHRSSQLRGVLSFVIGPARVSADGRVR
jgi:hypothetical protein